MQKTLIILLLIIQATNLLGQKMELISLDTAFENSSIEEVIVIYKNFKKKGNLFNEVSYFNNQDQLLYRITKKECYNVELKGQICEKTFQRLTKVGEKYGYQKRETQEELEGKKISFKLKRRYKTKNKRKREYKEENGIESTHKIVNLNDTTALWEVINKNFQIELLPIETTYRRKKIVIVKRYIANNLTSKTYIDFKTGKDLKRCYFGKQLIINEIWQVKNIQKPDEQYSTQLLFYSNGNPSIFYDYNGSSSAEVKYEWTETGDTKPENN